MDINYLVTFDVGSLFSNVTLIIMVKGGIIFYGEGGRLSVISSRQFLLAPPLAHAKIFACTKIAPPLCLPLWS